MHGCSSVVFCECFIVCDLEPLIMRGPNEKNNLENSIEIVYKVSQEEWTKLRESVPYVKIYRYNPKHLYPKLNGYGDNDHRKVWASGGSTFCTPSVTSYSNSAAHVHCACPATRHRNAVTLANALQHGSSDVTR